MKKFGLFIGIIAAAGIIMWGLHNQKPVEQNVDTMQSEGRIRGPEEKTLTVGEEVSISGLTIMLNSVTQDFRCDSDVSCPERGGVAVNITLSNGEVEETKNMASDEVPMQFSGYKVSITHIESKHKASEINEQKDYSITFRVESTATTDTPNAPEPMVFSCDEEKQFLAIFSSGIAEVVFDDAIEYMMLLQSKTDPHLYTSQDGTIELSVEGDEAGAKKNGVAYTNCIVQ